ncbi:T9SS type A sorting domain-containing protein [Taibaiella soli]|uniref:MAM domain-containing protein n=1 Tax=Taibaiella soli TaxID=1649169 RepID=A0A2W2B4D1_9BACT|nr:GEVED domain-containing protein [Taibaiella soli]PZF70997.1 hypothetical protein DN068_20040 [Taibaiella soli]
MNKRRDDNILSAFKSNHLLMSGISIHKVLIPYCQRVKWHLLSLLSLMIFQLGQSAKAQTIQIGTGTTVTGYTSASPVNNYFNYEHVQYLFTAAEINALGIVGPQLIDSIGFNVVVAPATALAGYTINMVGTSMADLSTPYSGALNTVYSNSTGYLPVANSWNMIAFQTGFGWNGVDNIVLDICFGPVASGSSASGTVQFTTTANMGKYAISNVSSICGQALTSTTTYRPNTKLHFHGYPACTGAPSITTQTASPLNVCTGATPTLFANVSNASGLTFQWEKSVTGAAPWTPIAGATNLYYTFPAASSAYYHMVVTCAAGTATTGNPIYVNCSPVAYASIPYVQDFENWQNYCDSSDIPALSWTNQPARGNNSWRRNDKGLAAAWYSTTSGLYNTASLQVAKSGSYSARFHTYGTLYGAPVTTAPGNLDLYLDCSASATPKALSFWYNNSTYSSYNGDTLSILLSSDGGATFTTVGNLDTSTAWVRKVFSIASSAAQTVIRFQGRRAGTDISDILIDSVYVGPSCASQPVAGSILPSGTLTGCPGNFYIFNAAGATMAGNISYIWQQKLNGASSWTAVTGVVNNNGYTFTTPNLYDTIQYRLIVKCLGSNMSDTSQPVKVNIVRPVYAALPFTEDFENWNSRCYTTDIPANYWTNYPTTGNNSWRRDDQGLSAGWGSPAAGLTSPLSVSGAHSARYHGYLAAIGAANAGLLDLYVDCSTATGNKELQFYVKTQTSVYANDSVVVLLSTNGGNSFTTLAAFGPGSGGWDYHSVMVPSNSASTVLRFKARTDQTGYGDIAIDYVRLLPACTGKPSAGNVAPGMPCANQDFQITLQSSTQAGGITYQWQDSIAGSPAWTASGIVNATQVNAIANIATPTYFRCIVACSTSGLADTTPAYLANIAPFYYCYCYSAGANSTPSSTMNLGRVTLRRNSTGDTILNNGPGLPIYSFTPLTGYSDFRHTVAVAPVYRDSVFKISAQQVMGGTSAGTARMYAFVDYNRDGVFQASEMVFYAAPVASTTPPLMSTGTFIIPDTAVIGVTGMRVIIASTTATTFNPCNSYTYGETEDYLLDIRYPPCDGPTNPGIAISSDTALCSGYTFQLSDTTHEKHRSAIVWNWQQSISQGSAWNDVPGSAGRDTLVSLFNSSAWYRLRMICTATNDTTYSNIAKIREKLPYQCYCYSEANGGTNDVSDIGAFSIGNFVINTGGPHIKNPQATRSHSDYTSYGPIELYADSTYAVMIGHIMSAQQHTDARATMFMDFNNSLAYDIPSERISLINDVTSASRWFLIDSVKIPSAVVTDVPTGMRVILNNNIAPNVPSDEACGPYTSGETEDYVVIFRRANPLSVKSNMLVRNLALYPNPTQGQFTLSFKAGQEIRDLQVAVMNMSGQQLLQQNFSNVGNNFVQTFDLSQQARGVYFVEIKADGERTVQKVVIR